MLVTDAPSATLCSERLTWEQICHRYPAEWVVLAEFDRPGDEMDLEFHTAVVIAHEKSRKEASPHVKEAFKRYTDVGSFWTGKIVAPVRRLVLP
jgi:hypothetical protein